MNDSPFELHPFNFKNTTKTFEIIAETTNAPQIILMTGGSILATQFMVLQDRSVREKRRSKKRSDFEDVGTEEKTRGRYTRRFG